MKSSAIICILLVAGILAANDHFQGRADFPRGYKQLRKTSELHNTEIDFTFFIKSCNFAALDRFFWDVSNPKHDLYGKYMTLEELNDLQTCSEEDVPTVLEYINHFNVKEVKVIGPTAVEVRCTVAVAEQMLETEFFEVQNVKSGKIHIRQKGSVALPGHLHDIIEFVGGISEFFDETKYEVTRTTENLSKRLRSEAAGEPMYDPNIFDVADQWVTPILLQDAYSIPNTPLSDSNKLGIAAFDNDYDDFGFCRFQDLFGGYRVPPSITYQGPVGGADQVESDLDVQYSTAIASGISAIFQNHASNKWILDWATNSVQDANRPYVWSISYGWPEIWQCTVVDNLTTDCPTGYSYQKYINVTNQQLAALGSLGVSVLVSSGDAGTPGFSSNCPFNPNVEIFDSQTFNVTTDCQILFGKGATCGCGNAVVTFEFKNTSTVECVIPAGLSSGSAGCAYIFGEGEGGEGEGAESFQQQVAALCGEAAEQFGTTPQKDCQIANLILEDELFISTCNCSEVTPKTLKKANVGSCTVSGYDYQPSQGAAFFPDFPTTSLYVTSVGATAMQYTSAECSPSVYTPQIYAYTLDPAGFSGGGGFSSCQPSFAAQQSAVQAYLRNAAGALPPASTFNANNRAYPDVSFLGHNFIINLGLSAELEGAEAQGYGGAIFPVGGTSASSPSFAGMVARLNDYKLANNLPTLGPLNQLLYAMAAEAPGTFSDIVPHNVDFLNVTLTAGPNSNCNEAYCCEFGFHVTQGWDPATGLGTPNFNEILQYIVSMDQ